MNMRKLILGTAAGTAAMMASTAAQAQDYYLGQIILVANNFCQRGSIEAAGGLLAVSTNTALFSLYGVTFGGNGQTTFGLPDLRGRMPNNWGQGQGLSPYDVGQVGGAETLQLNVTNLPMHTHTAQMQAIAAGPTTNDPSSARFADFPSGTNIYNKTTPPNVNMRFNTAQTASAGNNLPMPLHSPYLTLRYCVITTGLFPSRP